MGSIVAITGPSDAGPGERDLMLSRAQAEFTDRGVAEVTRVDVPPKGTGEESSGEGPLRTSVAPVVPALQSGSLFGDLTGILVVDAQSLLKGEAEVIAELVRLVGDAPVVGVFVAAGTIPAPLGKTLKEKAELVSISRLNERSAGAWLASAARERGIRLHGDAAEALIQRFGTDLASLGQALDQLAASGADVTADAVRSRFKNRPDEPSWLYMDSVTSGNRAEALRRLADFLQHGHPLILLAVIQGDLRRRALAAAAPDYETFAARDGGRRNYGMEKVWNQRNRVRASDLRLALDAVARADLTLKTAPEATHRVTMERLTVALCRWYGGAARAAS